MIINSIDIPVVSIDKFKISSNDHIYIILIVTKNIYFIY